MIVIYLIIFLFYLFILYLLYEFKEFEFKQIDLKKLINVEQPIYTYIIYHETGYAINKNEMIKRENPFLIKKKNLNNLMDNSNDYLFNVLNTFTINTSFSMIIYLFSLISFMIF
jgi:hypothetical protein